MIKDDKMNKYKLNNKDQITNITNNKEGFKIRKIFGKHPELENDTTKYNIGKNNIKNNEGSERRLIV